MSADPTVVDRNGQPGTVETVGPDAVRIRLPSGALIELPRGLVEAQQDGSYRADVAFDTLPTEGRTVLQEIEEQVQIGSRLRETGRVVARVATDTHEEPVDATGWRETVHVERVPVGRDVDSIEAPRKEGAVTVIPVYEEVLVIQKKLVLREEVRLTTRREPLPGPERVTLRRQQVEVERLPPHDAGD